MAFSWKDPHFWLKIVSLIFVLLSIFMVLRPYDTHDPYSGSYVLIIEGLTNTSAIVILVLIIAIVFLESPKPTEICLILSVLAMMIISCSLWCTSLYKRNMYLGVALPGILSEIVDVILHAMNK